MHAQRPLLLAAFSMLLLLPLSTSDAGAHDDTVAPHSHPRLKHRIVELENALATLRADTSAALTQLRSALDYQGREDANGAPSAGGGGATGLCGDPCATDSDGDGLGDCEDPCPCEASTADSDGDGSTDCLDPCPDDNTDACIDPCRNDSDLDDVNDCEDPCPWDATPVQDSDGDGIVDCQDGCPDDPADGCYDWCELDQDGDGVADCKDPCPWAGEPAPGIPVADCAMPPWTAGRAR
jgi:hypothetical protein